MKRVVVFIDTNPIIYSPSLINLIEFLAEQHQVDVCLRNVDTLVGKQAPVLQMANVTAIEFKERKITSFRHLIGNIKRVITRDFGVAKPVSIARAIKNYKSWNQQYREFQSQGNIYDLCITVNPEGYLFARELLPEIEPVYYSLELRISGEVEDYGAIIKAEKETIKSIKGLIIQSEERADAFREEYGISQSIPQFLLPVTYKGSPYKKETKFLRKKFDIAENKTIVLHFGGVTDDNRCMELLEAVGELEDTVLVFHGQQYKPYAREMLLEIEKRNIKNVLFSDEFFDDPNDAEELAASADIGIALYKDYSVNLRTAGKSSGKISFYFKCGLPVITNNYQSYKSAVEDPMCGICISGPEGIADAIKKINTNKETYVESVHRVFENEYMFENYKDGLAKFLFNSAN